MSEPPSPSIVILGGGIAGLTVAKSLADNNLPCTLVEKNERLGGRVRDWACMASERCLRCFACTVEDLVEEIEESPMVTVRTGWELSSIATSTRGLAGVGLRAADNRALEEIDASALVIATGFDPYDPSEKVFWGYGRLDGVFTLKDADEMVRKDDLSRFQDDSGRPLSVAFFQCIGSRDASIGANYCSQYCCKGALRMALRLLKEHPDWKMTIFYIDLQVAGKFSGSLLKEAGEKGIRLVHGVPGEIVEGPEHRLQVIREEDGRNVRETFDRVILSIGQRPPAGAGDTASLVGLSVNEFGFLSGGPPANGGKTSVPGVYLAGTCCGPKDIEATLEHAGQTASAIIADLSRSVRVE